MSNIYHKRFYAMGTRFHLILPHVDENTGFRIFQRINNEVNRIEKKLSRFVEVSDISRLNLAAKKHTAKVDDELFDILKACKHCREMTSGAFDPTLRPLSDGNQNALRESFGMNHVLLDEERKTVRFTNEHIEIDLGGFGKGYALEKIKNILEHINTRSAFINFGESSIYAHGNHPAGGAWKIGINNYLEPGVSAYEFRVRNGSVSTSSNFFISDDGSLRKHNHIINPFTGSVDSGLIAVSVSARSPVLAEMLSTAFISLNDDKICDVISQYDDLEAIKTDYSSGEAVVTRFHNSEDSTEAHSNIINAYA